MEIFIIGGIILIIVLITAVSEATKDKEKANTKLDHLEDIVDQVIKYRERIDIDLQKIDSERKKLDKYSADIDALVTQRAKGFPLLGEVYAEYFDIQGKKIQGWLRNKKRPAPKSADTVKEVTKEKRELIKQSKILEYKIKNYELIAPFLTEVEEEIIPEDDVWLLRDYSEEEMEDEVVRFVTKEEYRKLSPGERNQLALDRYWTRGKKSLWTIGKMYEHFVGYLYEKDGWDVEYFGIAQRYEDFGRDLIAIKQKKCHIVQCKNWSKYKTIYENHIFQLFGTTEAFKKEHPELDVLPVFYSTTDLSDTAKKFAQLIGMSIKDRFKLEKYPCIKCNISRIDEGKIYHLPFDQQYDNVKIEPKRKEFYAMTVEEAELKGFRRAFRWRGEAKK